MVKHFLKRLPILILMVLILVSCKKGGGGPNPQGSTWSGTYSAAGETGTITRWEFLSDGTHSATYKKDDSPINVVWGGKWWLDDDVVHYTIDYTLASGPFWLKVICFEILLNNSDNTSKFFPYGHFFPSFSIFIDSSDSPVNCMKASSRLGLTV